MPDMNGLDAARHIRDIAPDTLILILSVHKSKQLMEEARKVGVRGYVTKGEAVQKLVQAVDAVLQDRSYFPEDL
jgi:DNA-binding NarL/FixJ family response regulator